MRVLMVSDVYFPRINGVSTSIETFRRILPELGIKPHLIAPRYQQESDCDDIRRVSGYVVPGDREDRLVHWREMHRTVLEAARDCELIHIQTPFVAHYASLAAARKLGLPVVATYHTLFEAYLEHYAPFLPAGWLRRQARRFSSKQCNALDAVIVPSSAMHERLLDYGVVKPLHVLPTGIPLARFRHGDRQGFRYRHGILSTRPVALFVGRVAHEKNIGFLLDAVRHARAHCPEVLLLITGEGPAMDSLKMQVKQLGLHHNVQFLGYLDRESELADCYAAADIFAFASRTETQGLVLLEAMAAGLPVIALAEMGTRDILLPAKGAIVPPAESRSFGLAMADYLNQPARWRSMKEEAARYAESWSDRATAERLATLYRQLAWQHLPAEGKAMLAMEKSGS